MLRHVICCQVCSSYLECPEYSAGKSLCLFQIVSVMLTQTTVAPITREFYLCPKAKIRKMLGYELDRTLCVVVRVAGICSTATLGGSGSVEWVVLLWAAHIHQARGGR